MKKTYITPKAIVFQVSTQCMLAESGLSLPVGNGGTEVDGDGALSKEEKQSGAGIWDLY